MLEHSNLLNEVLSIVQMSANSDQHIIDLVSNITITFETFWPEISQMIEDFKRADEKRSKEAN